MGKPPFAELTGCCQLGDADSGRRVRQFPGGDLGRFILAIPPMGSRSMSATAERLSGHKRGTPQTGAALSQFLMKASMTIT